MKAGWLEKILNTYGRLHLAQDAVMVEDQRAYLADSRAANRAYQRTMLGAEFPGAAETKTEAEEMIVGDVTQHYHGTPPAKPNPLLQLVAAAALIATGAGAVAAIPLIADALKPKPAVTQTPPEFPDVPNWGLELLPPEDE